jgi:hypothetical protein
MKSRRKKNIAKRDRRKMGETMVGTNMRLSRQEARKKAKQTKQTKDVGVHYSIKSDV